MRVTLAEPSACFHKCFHARQVSVPHLGEGIKSGTVCSINSDLFQTIRLSLAKKRIVDQTDLKETSIKGSGKVNERSVIFTPDLPLAFAALSLRCTV